MYEQKKSKGLKALRKESSLSGPKHHCSNCKCNRYSPCTCQKKGK